MQGSRYRERNAGSIALLFWLASVGWSSVAVALARLAGGAEYTWLWALAVDGLVVGLATYGAVKIVFDPHNGRGWGVAALGLALSVTLTSHEYVRYAVDRSLSVGLTEWVGLAGWLAAAVVLLAGPFVFLLAPEGRLRSRHWRRFSLPLAAISAVSLVLTALGPLRHFSDVANPIGVGALSGVATVALWVGIPVAALTFLVALGARPQPPQVVQEYDEPATDEYELIKRKRKARKAAKKGAASFLKDFPRVLPYLRPYWHLFGASLAMLGVGVIVGLLSPMPLAILLDTVITSPPRPLPSLLGFLGGWHRTQLLVFAVVGGLVVTALASSIGVIETYVQTKLHLGMELDVRSALFEHAQRLSHAYHDKKKTGSMMFTINNQASAIPDVIIALPALVTALATLVGMFLIAYIVDSELALISLTVVPFIYLSTGYYAKRIEPRLYYVRNLEGQSMTIVYDAIAMLRVIVSFGREKYEHGRYYKQATEARDARVGLTVRQTMFTLAVNMLTAAGTALVLGIGAWHVIHGRLSAGELTLVMAYIASVYLPLEEISTTFTSLQNMFINLQMVIDLLDTEPEIQEAPDAITIERAEGRITFEGVSFKHSGRKRRTLKHIAFDAAPGSRVGIIGATGAGKTSLVNLIPRFYDPERGRVLLDGTDIKKLTLSSLRSQISIVQQDPLLFSDSILENIRYGRLDATDDEIFEAAKAANADDFVSALPEGYLTKLGERGSLLSGGERQRVAIARAFLKDSPILILDEPTAAIDSHTEAVILEALDRLAGNRTTFTIAHRLSTLGRADLILVIDQGRLVEQGTHEELMAIPDGLYRRTYELQSGPLLRLVRAPIPAIAPEPPPDTGPADPLVEALRLLLEAQPAELEAISTGRGEPLEIRLAAGILGVLSREDRDKLRSLDDAQLVRMLDEVRR